MRKSYRVGLGRYGHGSIDRDPVLARIYSDYYKRSFPYGSDVDHAEDFLYGRGTSRAENHG